jgi:hypothetical protein
MGIFSTGRAGENHHPGGGRSGRDSGPVSGKLARQYSGKPGLMGPRTGPGRARFAAAGGTRPRGSAGRPGQGAADRSRGWRW